MKSEKLINKEFIHNENKASEDHDADEVTIYFKGDDEILHLNEKESIFPYARKIYQRSRATGGRSSLGIF